MSKTIAVLVAAHQIVGGSTAVPAQIDAGEELTAEKVKALGLSDDEVAALVAKGALIEVEARAAETPAAKQTAAQ